MTELALCTRYTAMGASSRLRFFAYQKALEEAGFEVRTDCFYSENYLRTLYRTGRRSPAGFLNAAAGRFLRAFRLPERLFIEYELLPYFPFWIESGLLKHRRYVLSYDDDIFLRYGPSPNKLDRLMAGAAGVICANDRLMERAAKFQRNLLKVPTAADVRCYRQAAEKAVHPEREKLLGVWIGTPVTYRYLEQAAPQLRAMAAARPFRLRVIAKSGLRSVDGVEMEFVNWSRENEAELIAEADFGIMPLPADDDFAKGKSAYKIIQYLAAGLPVIASPVGENRVVITPECGFLADAPEAWADAVKKITDPELKAGARRRAADFDLAYWAPEAAKFIAEALN